MMYAFARDGGFPGHKFFSKVSSNWKSPIRTGLFFWNCMRINVKRWGFGSEDLARSFWF